MSSTRSFSQTLVFLSFSPIAYLRIEKSPKDVRAALDSKTYGISTVCPQPVNENTIRPLFGVGVSSSNKFCAQYIGICIEVSVDAFLSDVISEVALTILLSVP